MRSANVPKNPSHPGSEEELERPQELGIRPAPPETAVLTRQECSEWLGISVRHLARLDISCVKLGRLVRYSVPAVLRWMEERGQP